MDKDVSTSNHNFIIKNNKIVKSKWVFITVRLLVKITVDYKAIFVAMLRKVNLNILI